MSAIQTPEECDHSTSKKVLNDALGCLPNYEAINAPSTFVWGQHGDGRTITVSLSTIDIAYNEISKCGNILFSSHMESRKGVW